MVSRKLLTNIRSHTIGFLYYLMAVLTAIAIPVFTSQLERSREATDLSNIRAAYAEAVADYLADGAKVAKSANVTNIKQTVNGWQTSAHLYSRVNGSEKEVALPSNIAGATKVTVNVSAGGTVTVNKS